MFPASWDNLEKGLAAIRAFVRTGDAFRKTLTTLAITAEPPSNLKSELEQIALNAPSSLDWRISDYIAAISRTYALYENYVDDLLQSWIELRVEGFKYLDLPSSWRVEYEKGFAFVLSQSGEGRYEHLTHETMVVEHSRAISGEGNYRTFPECFTHRNSNIRLDILQEILGRCQIDKFAEWVDSSECLREFFGPGGTLRDRVQKRLKEFVKYRNDASHSSVAIDSIMGVEQIIECVDFIQALSESLRDKVHSAAVEFLIETDRARHVGRITRVYSDNVTVATLEAISLKNGERLLIKSSRMCNFRIIENLRMDDVDQPAVVVGLPAEVGIKFDKKVRVSDSVIHLISPPTEEHAIPS